MLLAVNRKFDLKVGDKVRALGPMSAWDSENDYTYKIYKVIAIYDHIFIGKTQQAEDTVAERCFRKTDYISRFISKI